MEYIKMLRAMKVASEDTKRIMRVGVRNASKDCETEAAEGFSSEGPESFLEIDRL